MYYKYCPWFLTGHTNTNSQVSVSPPCDALWEVLNNHVVLLYSFIWSHPEALGCLGSYFNKLLYIINNDIVSIRCNRYFSLYWWLMIRVNCWQSLLVPDITGWTTDDGKGGGINSWWRMDDGRFSDIISALLTKGHSKAKNYMIYKKILFTSRDCSTRKRYYSLQ